jgi:hypothetical protein
MSFIKPEDPWDVVAAAWLGLLIMGLLIWLKG